MSQGFQMIDVFGSGALLGNPLAVVHDAEGLTTDEMQAITRLGSSPLREAILKLGMAVA